MLPSDEEFYQQIIDMFQNKNLEQNSTKKQINKNKKCKPVQNIIFVKTHKTGSSTVMNVIQRYAHIHNLTMALPGPSNFLGWPGNFTEWTVFEHTGGKKYNIICNHARFNKKRMLKIIKGNDTKIITIIRDPLYQFESMNVYYRFYDLFKLDRKKNYSESLVVLIV